MPKNCLLSGNENQPEKTTQGDLVFSDDTLSVYCLSVAVGATKTSCNIKSIPIICECPVCVMSAMGDARLGRSPHLNECSRWYLKTKARLVYVVGKKRPCCGIYRAQFTARTYSQYLRCLLPYYYCLLYVTTAVSCMFESAHQGIMKICGRFIFVHREPRKGGE